MSRATIRAAVGRLVGRGLLVRRQGSGTFLARLPEQEGQPSPVGIKLSQPAAALMMTETMYLDSAVSAEGRPVQWSRNYFLPGRLSLRLVRDTPTNRDPAIVLQLFAQT